MNGLGALGRRRTFWRRAVTALIGPDSTFACPFGGLPLGGRGEIDAGPPCLRQADGDRLFRRSRSVFALADVVHFLADKLTGLGRRRLALTFVLPCSFHGFLFRHGSLP